MGNRNDKKDFRSERDARPNRRPTDDLQRMVGAANAAAAADGDGAGGGGVSGHGEEGIKTYDFALEQIDPNGLAGLRVGARCKLPTEHRAHVYHGFRRVGKLPKEARSQIMRWDPSRVIVLAVDAEAIQVAVRLYLKRG